MDPAIHASDGSSSTDDVGRPDGGDEAEEHEDEQLAETEVAVRLGAAGVPPRGEDRQRADEQQPPGGGERQYQSGHAGHGERQQRRPLHRAGAGQPAGDEAHRTDAHLVGAAHTVAVVVGVVHPDLQGEADDEREQRPPPDRLADPDGDARAECDGDDRGGQRARAGAEHPLVRGRCCRRCGHRSTLPHDVAQPEEQPSVRCRPCTGWWRSTSPVDSSSSRRCAGSGTTVTPHWCSTGGPRRRRRPPSSTSYGRRRSSTLPANARSTARCPSSPATRWSSPPAARPAAPKGVVLTHDAVRAQRAGDHGPARADRRRHVAGLPPARPRRRALRRHPRARRPAPG